MAKERVPIPKIVAARVLFQHDRRCCICRQRKPVQIHHIDEDPSNNDASNLAVLCLDCHRDTQIHGGFDRKLDDDQVRLYRDDWVEHVRRARLTADVESEDRGLDPALSTAVAAARLEIAKDKADWLEVALIYHEIGDYQLRDKYAAQVLAEEHEAWEEALLRRHQRRLDLLSESTIAEALDTDDWTVKARFLADLGRIGEAARVYMDGIRESIENDNPFTAAFYIKYGLSRLQAELFEDALAQASAEQDLWWQLRALDELGWTERRAQLLLENEASIRESGTLLMRLELAKVTGDRDAILQAEKDLADAGPRGGRSRRSRPTRLKAHQTLTSSVQTTHRVAPAGQVSAKRPAGPTLLERHAPPESS